MSSFTISCKELFECFMKGGGKLTCDYKKKQCSYNNNKHTSSRESLLKCDLSKTNNQTAVDRLLWEFAPHGSIDYERIPL